MKKGLIIGIVVLWVVWVILTAIPATRLPGWTMPAILVGILLGTWIYFVWMVWKKGTSLFHKEMKPELAERRLKRLNNWLMVAGISWVAINGGLVAMALEPLFREGTDPYSMVIPFFGIIAIIIATIGSLVTFLKGRRKTPE